MLLRKSRRPRLSRTLTAAALTAASLLGFPHAASAASIFYSFKTGTALPSPHPSVPHDLFGDLTVSGRFTYDNSAGLSFVFPDDHPLGGQFVYNDALLHFSAVVGDNSIWAASGFATVGDNNYPPLSTDALRLGIGSTPFTGFPIGDFDVVFAQIGWFEGFERLPDFLTDQSLPRNLHQFGSPLLSFALRPKAGAPPGGPIPVVNFRAQLTVVPEPSTWAMMLLGFGAVGGAIRSAKRRQRLTLSSA